MSPAEPRRDLQLVRALRDIAPGTPIREATDDVIRGRTGALFVMADAEDIEPVLSGGIRIDVEFSPKLVYQLAKMDGAIVLDRSARRIKWANVQLVPDPQIPSSETGTRHRSAERTARQIKALVIAVSASRDVVTLYTSDTSYQLEPIRSLLIKVNQALATLETYRMRLDQVSHRLLSRELAGTATLLDALVVIQRAEMAKRMVAEIERHQVELGLEGRLTEMQLRELSVGVMPDRSAVVRDYMVDTDPDTHRKMLDRLGRIGGERLLRLEDLEVLLGYDREVNPIDTVVEPRGYRVLSRIPGLSQVLVERLVQHFGSLTHVLAASPRELAVVSGLGPVRSREVYDSLRRMQTYFSHPQQQSQGGR
ncbi:MAG: integrity scanning protein DisA [Thermoleophilia bacterium]|nr:integrity scanning protein DisA [Thermoleophilia bacterium]